MSYLHTRKLEDTTFLANFYGSRFYRFEDAEEYHAENTNGYANPDVFEKALKEDLKELGNRTFLVMDRPQNILYGKILLANGFELKGNSTGIHGTPIFLYVRRPRKRKPVAK